MLKPSYPNFRDLKLFVKICKDLKISLYKLEKNVVAYRTTRGRCITRNAKFPIEINPIFDMIYCIYFLVMKFYQNRRKRTVLYYRQFDKKHRYLFLKKFESLFGKIVYKENYFDSLNRSYLPTRTSIYLVNNYGKKERQ